MVKATRWKQRFESFTKALQQLEEAVRKDHYSNLEIAGVIKTFEFSFELGWKTLKDLLEKEGYEVKTPRQTIKQAFQSGYIEDGQGWLEALNNRSIMSHTYDEEDSQTALRLIKESYFMLLKRLYETLSNED